ncbi:MAG TPA: Flp pilus assembly protein CpaB, partial [Solirubrobacterales bacterium]|nr:Flp pilus assembly protein CpaB [Solirubrobacterales bacterium]
SRRARAVAFLAAAAVCAILAAALAGKYRSRVEARYGPLRPVVVASAELPAGQPIGLRRAREALALRRVPASFAPPGALSRIADALGRAPGATIPAGSYVLGAQLIVPQPEQPSSPGVGRGRRPVQVNVAGAEALTVAGEPPEGSRVDVVVARQAGLGNSARAHIAATGIKLLTLRGPAAPGESWSATLAVSARQALELIGAQSAGREIRLLPRP